jgi:predicted porin
VELDVEARQGILLAVCALVLAAAVAAAALYWNELNTLRTLNKVDAPPPLH